MREDTPKPDDWIGIETTRFTIDTGTSPKPRPKRRHPLLSLFKKGTTAIAIIAAIIAAIITIATAVIAVCS